MNIFIITALNFLLLILKARPTHETFLLIAFYHWVIFSFSSPLEKFLIAKFLKIITVGNADLTIKLENLPPCAYVGNTVHTAR